MSPRMDDGVVPALNPLARTRCGAIDCTVSSSLQRSLSASSALLQKWKLGNIYAYVQYRYVLDGRKVLLTGVRAYGRTERVYNHNTVCGVRMCESLYLVLLNRKSLLNGVLIRE